MTTPGLYRHFKGTYVRVLFTALDSETKKPLVFTCTWTTVLYGYVRKLFHETVTRGSFQGPRFLAEQLSTVFLDI
jgi:hypothetical protein